MLGLPASVECPADPVSDGACPDWPCGWWCGHECGEVAGPCLFELPVEDMVDVSTDLVGCERGEVCGGGPGVAPVRVGFVVGAGPTSH